MAQLLRKHATGDKRGDYKDPALLSFVTGLMANEDAELRRIRENTVKDGLPPISIGPDEGKILDLLARLCGARKAVEIGTLAGYSGAWLARAVGKTGRLDTIEFEPKHAAVARRNFERAGVADRVEVHEGPALEVLPSLEAGAPYDLCFIDADKVNYEKYGRWAGGDAAGAAAMRGFLKLLADEELFSSCAMIPTGEGLAVAVRS